MSRKIAFVIMLTMMLVVSACQKSEGDSFDIVIRGFPRIEVIDDSGDGGNSKTALTRTDSSVILDYQLQDGYAYPHAGIRLYLGDGKAQGVDLSEYDSIFVKIRSRGESSVRLDLYNFDSSFSRVGDFASLKINELEFKPKEEPYPAVFIPREFHVASWWVGMYGINVHKAYVDVSNVTAIEIQTGMQAFLGYGTIELLGIRFAKKK